MSLQGERDCVCACMRACMRARVCAPPHSHVLGGDLREAVHQLRDQVLVSAGQQVPHLLRDARIVQQALGGGGRQRRGQRQLVQHCMRRDKKNQENLTITTQCHTSSKTM